VKECVLILETDKGYLNHARFLISNLIETGKWKGDICLITCAVPSIEVEDLKFRGVIIKEIPPETETYYIKFYAFDHFFKKWQYACHLDLDFLIFDTIELLLEQNIPKLSSFDIVADAEEYTIKDTLANYTHSDFKRLEQEIDVNRPNFNAGFFLYATRILHDNYVGYLFREREKYREINKHNGLAGGADQPVLNIVFYNRWTQVHGVCYYTKYNSKIIGLHTYRWSSPWTRHVAHYKRSLEIYNNINESKCVSPHILMIVPAQESDQQTVQKLIRHAWFPLIVQTRDLVTVDKIPDSVKFVVFADKPILCTMDWDKRLIELLVKTAGTVVSPLSECVDGPEMRKKFKKWCGAANIHLLKYHLLHHRVKFVRSLAKRGFWKQVPNEWYYSILPLLSIPFYDPEFFMCTRETAVDFLQGKLAINETIRGQTCIDVCNIENPMFISIVKKCEALESICGASKVERTFKTYSA
jgi:hypothetical protein